MISRWPLIIMFDITSLTSFRSRGWEQSSRFKVDSNRMHKYEQKNFLSFRAGCSSMNNSRLHFTHAAIKTIIMLRFFVDLKFLFRISMNCCAQRMSSDTNLNERTICLFKSETCCCSSVFLSFKMEIYDSRPDKSWLLCFDDLAPLFILLSFVSFQIIGIKQYLVRPLGIQFVKNSATSPNTSATSSESGSIASTSAYTEPLIPEAILQSAGRPLGDVINDVSTEIC